MASDEIPDSVEFMDGGGFIERWADGKIHDDITEYGAMKGVRVGYTINDDDGIVMLSLTFEWIHEGRHCQGPTIYGDRQMMGALAKGINAMLTQPLPDEFSHMEFR